MTGARDAGYCKYVESIAKNGRPGGEQWSCRCQADSSKQEARLTSWSPTQLDCVLNRGDSKIKIKTGQNGFHKFCKSLAIERVHEQGYRRRSERRNRQVRKCLSDALVADTFPPKWNFGLRIFEDPRYTFLERFLNCEISVVYRADKLHCDNYNHENYFQ